MERLTPSHLLMIIALSVLVVAGMGLWDWRTVVIEHIMSVKKLATDYVARRATAQPSATATQPIAATEEEPLRPIATASNESNEALSGNVVLRARAELIARMIKSDSLYIPDAKGGYKSITQTTLIEIATGLKPNGRPDSDYGRLRSELEPLINPTLTIAPGKSDERVIAK